MASQTADSSVDDCQKAQSSSLKIIHALGFYFPDSHGGTEVYVLGLVKQLALLGIAGVIAAAQTGDRCHSYFHETSEVFRYPVPAELSKQELRGKVPPNSFKIFEEWLSKQDASIYHQHSWTSGCGLHHLRAAKRAGKTTVVTLHLPATICLRGTMLLNGTDVCDGEIGHRCGSCWAKARGINDMLASTLAVTPLALSRKAARLNNSRVATAIATPALVESHREQLIEMSELADRIVAVSQWEYDALLRNKITPNKLVLSRQGITDDSPKHNKLPIAGSRPTLRVGFFGRWDEVKGVHIIVDAVKKLPSKFPIELTVYALPPTSFGESYRRRVISSASEDSRIQFAAPIFHDDVRSAMSTFDVIAVPSQWLETGPLVVLEAHAAGVPVLGSDRGGIAEFIEDGVNGLLIAPGDTNAWSKALINLLEDRSQLPKLRAGIGRVRTMRDVAREMADVYVATSGLLKTSLRARASANLV